MPLIVAVAPGVNVAGAIDVTEGVSEPAAMTIAAEPVCASLAAVISTLPGANVVTNPVASTAATAGLLVLHATTRPESVFP